MVTKYYTGAGDSGDTQIGGKRILKCDVNVEAIGDIDELNSFVGLARAFMKNKDVDEILKQIQNKLFTAGAEIGYGKGVKIISADVKFLEDTIDQYAEKTGDINYFIYPAGSQLASLLHVCRAVCRRAERSVVSLSKAASQSSEKEKINPELLRYLNRLSSLFFVLARFANKEAGIKDEKWRLIAPIPFILNESSFCIQHVLVKFVVSAVHAR